MDCMICRMCWVLGSGIYNYWGRAMYIIDRLRFVDMNKSREVRLIVNTPEGESSVKDFYVVRCVVSTARITGFTSMGIARGAVT